MNFRILLSIIYVISSSYVYMPTQAFAADGKEGDRCKSEAQKYAQRCDEIMAELKDRGLLRGQMGTQMAGKDINRNANILDAGASGQQMDINQGISLCQNMQKMCLDNCNKEKQSYSSAVSSQEVPSYFQMSGTTKTPKPTVQSQKQALQEGGENICNQQMTEKLAQLGAEGQSMGDTAQDAQKTDAASDLGEDINEGPAKSGGGGMSPMMAGLLGAALGAGAAMLMNKKKEDKEKKKKEEAEKDPVAEDGTVDCSAPGAEIYSDCNEQFAAKCAADPKASGCATFSSRYCSGTAKSSGGSATPATGSTPNTSTSGIIIASAADKNITGEGLGTQFCFTVQATAFCSTSGRETCPSCLQLQTNKASACASNPVLCMAQNNPTDINAAKNSCPSDPMFSNPEYMAGGGSTVGDTSGLSAPILPGQFASSNDSSSLSGANAGANSEVAGSGGSGGSPSDAAGSAGSSGSGGSYSSSGSSSGSFGGGQSSEIARGAPAPILPSGPQIASVGVSQRAPNSVGGVMGPSLFSMSSAMIESRCRQGQLAHCSK